MSDKIIISFESLSREEQQAFVNFQVKERARHEGDIAEINRFIDYARTLGIQPQMVYVGKWIK